MSQPSFVSIVYFIFSRETWERLVQPTGKYCSIRHMEYPKCHSGIFGRMESAPGFSVSQFTLVAVPFPFPDPVPDSGFPGFPYAQKLHRAVKLHYCITYSVKNTFRRALREKMIFKALKIYFSIVVPQVDGGVFSTFVGKHQRI